MSKYYDGTTHIFYSETGGETYIRAKPGQALNIEADLTTVIADQQVVFSDSGSLAGSASFKYDGTDLAVTNGIKTGNIYGTLSNTVINTIDLVNTNNQIDITAATGVKFSTNTESTSITTGSVQMLGGLGVSKNIWATKYNSPNGAFKAAKWVRTTNQAYSTPALANVLYNSEVLNEITALSYNSGTGVFTVNAATRLFIAAFTRYFSAQNLSTILRNTTSSINLFAATNTDGLFNNPGLSMSCVVDLAANTSFSVQVFASASSNILGSATNNETFISFYSLN